MRDLAAMNRTILAAAVLIPLPAFAQALNYDTGRHCAEFARGSQTAENSCRRDEAEARRELETTRVSPEAWSYCTEQIRAEQSYVLFYGCALNEEARANLRRAAPAGVGSTTAPASNPGAESADRNESGSGSISLMGSSNATMENPQRHHRH